LTPLRIGVSPSDTYAQAYYAQDMGFFQKASIAAELQPFNTGAAISAAILGGSLDVGCSTPIYLANAILRDVPFVLIAPGAMETPQSPVGAVVVAKSSPIQSAKDIEGKTVGINGLKSLSEVALNLWLAEGGADVNNVRKTEVAFSEMAPALERGTVVAALFSEPTLSLAMKSGTFRILVDPYAAIAPRFLVTAWFTTATFLQKNADLVRRFQRAITDAGQWANGHHDESGTILAKYSKLDPAVIHAMTRCPYGDRLRAADIQPQLDVAFKYGLVPKVVSAADMMAR
jgi:NitT/TauT family transport system substrate-binding protein